MDHKAFNYLYLDVGLHLLACSMRFNSFKKCLKIEFSNLKYFVPNSIHFVNLVQPNLANFTYPKSLSL